MTPAILASKRHRRYLKRVWRRYPTALNRLRFRSKYTSAINRCQRQNPLTIPKLLLSNLVIIGLYLMDDGRVTTLTLLNLSAAFDTTDHTILLRRLGNWFGVSGKALDWFKSYLTGRSQRIKLGNCLSSGSDLSVAVPQGSVLGPLPFTPYTTPLSSLVSGHAIPHHLYADDSQLYVSFSSGDSAAALTGPQSCLASVQSWMSTNKLKLNPHKTEFLLIGNERQRSKYLSVFPIELLGVETYPAKSPRNLGVTSTSTSTSAHIYLQSAVHVFTTSGIYGVFAVTLIWIVQNSLRMF